MESRTVVLVGIRHESEVAVAQALTDLSLGVEAALNLDAALEFLGSMPSEAAAIVLELSGPEEESIDGLLAVRRVAPHLPVIVTAHIAGTGLIVTALKSGAMDFVCQPANADEWRKALDTVVNGGAETGVRPRAEAAIPGAFVGRSPAMAAIANTLPQIAWSDAPVLIQGETGAGKEVLARALHAQSPRSKRPFFKLNCAALPSELVESELFGYERGAFTGAFQRKPGIFEAADGGTVLLDEIGDMDVRLQAKLLQVLQDHAFQRIGGKELIKVDVRVLAATHRDLERSIEDGNFREDLYYRLNVVNIVLPPLRERKTDLFDLMDALLKKHARAGEMIPELTSGLRDAMMAWHWPGNVRELENFARKLLIFRECSHAERDLRERIRRQRTSAPVPPQQAPAAQLTPAAPEAMPADDLSEPLRLPVMAEVERVTQRAEADAIRAALNAARWNRRVAATILNVDYKCLLYRMKKLGIGQQRSRGAEDAAESAAVAAVPASPEHGDPEWGRRTTAAGS